MCRGSVRWREAFSLSGKRLFFLLGFLGVMVGCATADERDIRPETSLFAAAPKTEAQGVRIFLGGDVNFSWGVEALVARGQDPFAHVRGLMRQADICVVNLETTVATNGVAQVKTHVFRSPPSVLHWLTNAGVDVVSLANNHAMDYGPEAMLAMREHLRGYGLLFTGAGSNWEEAVRPVILTQKGVTVGIVCAGFQKPEYLMATDKRPGTAGLMWKRLLAVVRQVKKEVDYLVFFVHWGWEYTVSPVETSQVKYAHAVIDAGADVIVGHHPHIIQGFENYRGKPIFYSVGNFLFPQWDIQEARPALAVVLDVVRTEKGLSPTVYVVPLYRLARTLQPVVAGSESDEVYQIFVSRSRELGSNWTIIRQRRGWMPWWRLELVATP